MNVFRSIIDIGTRGQNEVTDKKHIRFANSISLIICFFIIQNIAISLVYTQYLIALVQSLHFIFIALVLYWNYKGRRVLASAWFSSSAIFFVTIYAIIFTLESLNFTFLMMIILLQVFLFSPSEKKYIIVFIAMTVLCFAAVLVVAGLYPSVGERIPEGLINAQRWNTIVGLPMLSTLMAIYVLFTISKAEEEAAKKKASLEIAQRQLIQSEKMASLGELTAGIAHEIQNPLNFVNNFSEVSGELIDDVQQEIEKGDLEETNAILQDLKENLSKINHHGKRAGSIVKGMLEHSRKSQGKKELTDLNLLADECLRLSFHGLRAKDKSFTADFDTHFDPDLPKIEVVSQEIGRVLINLINNAFYAVFEKSKTPHPEFRPELILSTKRTEMGVEISVQDNGPGIPEAIKTKIFEPFFTTKPTGSGTGLGLSLSYDIVKAHGGELEVESENGAGSTFYLRIPFS